MRRIRIGTTEKTRTVRRGLWGKTGGPTPHLLGGVDMLDQDVLRAGLARVRRAGAVRVVPDGVA
ncbi:hypothetical protein ADL01_24755 [Streptomyces sp. NRRL WC-3618]|nr:hypothetical protein ADL01_24755 [Streptomyces sp. NRRL WC-3618]